MIATRNPIHSEAARALSRCSGAKRVIAFAAPLAALLATVLLAALAPSPAGAQSCALPASPVFAGHAFPLDTDPTPQAMRFDLAFPALSFASPVGVYAAPDGSDRLFVVEQPGQIMVFENRDDVPTRSVFLDIRSRVFSGTLEQGLLGLAFDPEYATNGRFYVNYTTLTNCSPIGNNGCTKISRFQVDPGNPNAALSNSEVVLLQYAQPFENHNGGALAFGPDGMLYVASGDGGSGGDPFRNAQNLSSRLGKILRLDVRAGAPSLVPADNPFVANPNADPFVYHYGLRNPWRISFDRVTGDLLIGDVGQDTREEVDRVRAGQPAGLNFGWDYCEATRSYRSGTTCSAIASTKPVIEYDHSAGVGGFVIIGGYVYRGEAFPELYGAYLFADAATANFWAWDGQDPPDPNAPGNTAVLVGSAPPGLSSFGEDRDGEIFAVSSATGRVYRLARNGGGGSGIPFPATLAATGLFSNVATLTPAPGLIEYDVATPLWSDGATKRRWLALPGEGRIAFHARGAWEFPLGTALVKHFELPKPAGGTRRVETRIFVRQNDRWIGVTYRWNTAGTDATLLTAGLDETIDLGSGETQAWHYPSTVECLTCHTLPSGRVLGVRTNQLEGARTFAHGTQPQIDAWNCARLFDFDLRNKSRYAFGRAVDDTSASPTLRARSYAAANCEMCHQPGGPAPGGLDLRFEQAVGRWNVLGVTPSEGNLGLPNAKRIQPGDRFNSIFWLRQISSNAALRMPKGTKIADDPAANLFGEWILGDVVTVDSDADGVVDASDRCPSVPDPLQLDGDGDLIGDACDPDALPDPRVLSQSAPQGTVLPGQTLTFSATVKNEGAGTSASFPVTYYLSADAILDPAVDVPVGHCWIESLAPGASTSCATNSARIPPSFRTGSPNPVAHQWIACANRAEVEREKNVGNACVATSGIAVPEPGGFGMLAVGSIGLVRFQLRRSARRRRTSGLFETAAR